MPSGTTTPAKQRRDRTNIGVHCVGREFCYAILRVDLTDPTRFLNSVIFLSCVAAARRETWL